MILGIDFGTCYSYVSVMIGDSIVDDAVTSSGSANIPTQYLFVNNKEYFGRECNSASVRQYRDKIIKDIKTKVRENPDNLKMTYGEGTDIQTLEDIIDKFIRYLIELSKSSVKEPIEYVAITSPSALTKRGMQSSGYSYLLKKTVMEATGLDESHVFVKQEPVAAAYSYLYDNKVKKDQSIFVFDLGGGTLDVSVVDYDYKSDEMSVVATDGENIGGNLWTRELSKLVKTDMVNREFDVTDLDQTFYDNIEEMKITLSDKDTASIPVTDEYGYKQKITISRQRFELITEGLLYQCLELVSRVLNRTGRTFDDIDKLVLVGGSSNMPQIKNMFLGLPGVGESKIEIYKPSEAIARGAALFAKKNGEQSGDAALGPSVKEVAPHTYGIELFPDDDADSTQIKNIIFKGDEFEGGRIYATLDKAISPKGDYIKHKMKFSIYESDYSKGENKNDFVPISKRTVPIGKPISIMIPSGYYEKPSKYRVRVSLILNSDNNLAVKVVEDTERRKVVVDKLLDCSYKGDSDE